MSGRQRISILAAILVALFLLAMLIMLALKLNKPPQDAGNVGDKGRKEPIIVAFMEANLAHGLASITAELKGHVNVASPHWIRFNAAGRLVTQHGSSMLIETAHQEGIKVWPLVAYSGPYGVGAGCPQVLCDAVTASSFVQSMTQWAETLNVDGLVLDVEYVSPVARDGLVDLTKRLADAMHAQGRRLWVAVFPQVDFSPELSDLHDVAALAASADGIILMTYDQHSPRTKPGPVAAYDWVERNVIDIVKQVPPEKVLLGLPAYGYRWVKRSGDWQVSVVATRQMEQENGERQTADGELWWESTEQAVKKVELALRHGLGGVAVWRQGLASPRLWSKLKQALSEGSGL